MTRPELIVAVVALSVVLIPAIKSARIHKEKNVLKLKEANDNKLFWSFKRRFF